MMISFKYNMYIQVLFIILGFINIGESVRCYQCSSAEDLKYQDNCGAYKKFDELSHTPVDCNTAESHTPGTFCMKVTQQSPRGFIWDGRWRQVIRRCASVADTGVTGVCNWGVYPNGIYWEECYCSEDRCNSANYRGISKILVISLLLWALWRNFR